MIRWAIVIWLTMATVANCGEAIIDGQTGRLIAGVDADTPRFPASTTKLMTIFVALEAAAKGEIDLNAPIKVSGHAAAAPPVKLGLKKGESIRLGDAIHAALIVSSNDAARVIAEAVAGSEQAFAQRMTDCRSPDRHVQHHVQKCVWPARCRAYLNRCRYRKADMVVGSATRRISATSLPRATDMAWSHERPPQRYGRKRHGRPVRQDRLYLRSRVRGGSVGRNFKRNPRVRDDGEFGTWAPGKIAETLG